MSVTNGNGSGRWAGVTPAAVVFALIAGVLGVAERGYTRDRHDFDARLKVIETGPDNHSALAERVEHVRQLAMTNRDGIQAAFHELDTKLQRELSLADDTLRAELMSLDGKLQGEIANNMTTRIAQLEAVHLRLSALESALRDVWTGVDQAQFEAQAGLRLVVQ